MGWAGGLGMLVLMLFLLTALIVVAVVLRRRWQPATPDRTARQILDERFARGEIDHEDYERRRDALTGA
jgi:putative membrane protein